MRWSNLSVYLALLFQLTLLASSYAADSDIVINELMYHPPLERDQLQYVELFNRGKASVELSGWSFCKGIQYVFPEKVVLAPGAFLVVCRNRQAFTTSYGSNIQALGDFSGRLSHSGEKVELCNARGQKIDSLHYSDMEPWPRGADGYSASLERICPFASGKEAGNWAASAWLADNRAAGTPGRQNDSFSATLAPAVRTVQFGPAQPNQEITVSLEAVEPGAVKAVSLLYYRAYPHPAGAETELPMQRYGEPQQGAFRASIPAQPADTLVRFRIKVVGSNESSRFVPSPNEPCPTYSLSTFQNTNNAHIPFAYVFDTPGQVVPQQKAVIATNEAASGPTNKVPGAASSKRPQNQNIRMRRPPPTTYNHAFVFVPPGGGKVQLFDYVQVPGRSGGFKVHFHKDRLFKGMTGINVIFEGPPRWVLCEPLAYEVYRRAKVPAPLADHLRVWRNGQLLGYQLMIEQPNKAFLTRNQRDSSGNLYKLLWYGQGLVGQHEKKTNLEAGHKDLVEVVNTLQKTRGEEQWSFIQKTFNVEECASYYAVNMCIQNWDGFHNNYFTYHDTGGTGKWEIYPWDQDKTWGDYDGASAKYDWYEMPLTMGMRGDPYGGGNWWREGSWFSGPLLANPEFRKRFLARLQEICQTAFTEEKFTGVIDLLEKRLEPEIAFRARMNGENPAQALKIFHEHMQSFRNQLKYRRQYILEHIPK